MEAFLIGVVAGAIPTVIVSVIFFFVSRSQLNETNNELKEANEKLNQILKAVGKDPIAFAKDVSELRQAKQETERKTIVATLAVRYNLAPEVVEKLGLSDEEK